GTSAVGKGLHGISIAFNSNQNAIGGGVAAAMNVISGNAGDGINISGATDTRIVGNYLGTDATGTGARGNGGRGLYVQSATGTVIGDVGGNGNLISGNLSGVQVDSSLNVQVVNNLV